MARTVNYNLELIDFNKIPWHEKEHDNWRAIDAIFASFISINNMQGVWLNAIDVTIDTRYVDPELGTIWKALVAHTTPSTGLFEASRIAQPTYWELVSDVALAESWATSLTGLVNGTDYSSKAYAIGDITQMPAGSSKYWQALSAIDAIATAADAIDTAADVVSTNADVISTGNDVTATNADVVITTQDAIDTAADVVTTTQDAIDTAADAVSTAADVITISGLVGTQLFSTVTNLATADSPKTLVDGDNGTFYTCTMDGNLTILLPSIAVVGEGDRYGFQRVGAANTLTFTPDGSETINGNASMTIDADTEVVMLLADDASPDNWIAYAMSQSFAGSGITKTGSTFTLDLTSDQAWTGSQRSTFVIVTEGTGLDMNTGQNWKYTPAGADVLSFANITNGQSGIITLYNPSGYAITGTDEVDADFYTTISVAGTYIIGYVSDDGSTVQLTNSAVRM